MIIISILLLIVGIVLIFFSQWIVIWYLKRFYQNNLNYFQSKNVSPPDASNFVKYFKYVREYNLFERNRPPFDPKFFNEYNRDSQYRQTRKARFSNYADSTSFKLYLIWRISVAILGVALIVFSIEYFILTFFNLS